MLDSHLHIRKIWGTGEVLLGRGFVEQLDMTCYAMACRQAQPCLESSHCERHWHACQVPDTTTIYHWTCGDCRDTWTLHMDHVWHRDPLNGVKL